MFKNIFFIKLKNIHKIKLFKLPDKCDIVIYDETRSDLIKNYLPSEKEVFIFKTREKILYFSKYLFLDIIKILLRKEYRNLIFMKGFSKGSLRIFKDAYHAAVLNYLNPSTAISFIDNNPRFGRLSLQFKKIRFIAIQNGRRSIWEVTEGCNHDIYLNFSKMEAINLKKNGWLINKSYSIGSLNASRVFSSINTKNVKRDLLIISSWRGNIKMDSDYYNQFYAMEEMHFYLNNLIKKENYKASIILRSQKNDKDWYIKKFGSNEEDFYKKIYGDNCEIIQNTLSGEIYREINNSYLSLAFLTSAIFEAYLYGHKSLFLNFYKNDYYHHDFPEEIVVNKYDLALMSLKIKNKIRESKRSDQEILSISKTKSKQTLIQFEKILNKYIK